MELPDVETDPTPKIDPPQDLLVVGGKKDWDPIEEFWMEKLSKVEEQYEAHMVNLERALLEKKVNRRVVSRQGNQIQKLKQQLAEKAQESEKYHRKSAALETDVFALKKENQKLEEKLSMAVSRFTNVDKDAKLHRAEIRKCNKEIQDLRKKLKQLENEKKLLTQDVNIKEDEKSRFQEKDAVLWRQKTHLLRNLKALDTERQVQTITNLKLNQNIINVLEDCTLRDKRILLLRRELEDAVQAMKKQRATLEACFRQRGNVESKLSDSKDQIEQSSSKLDELNSQILSLKEELDYKEVTEKRQNSELKKLKGENRYLRSQLAELNENLSKLQSHLKSLEKERDRLHIELRKMKAQDKAIQNLMRQNAFQKMKLKHKVSGLPPIDKTLEDDTFSRKCPSVQIDGYKKKIWDLERKLADVERKIEESQRRENSYRVRMQRFSALKEQLFWTRKAMLRLEADRQGMEQMIQSFAKTMPRKIAFEKLVTDPSILDRIAKHKVLQQRLATQTQKVEHMKEITMFLLKNEERRRAEDLGGSRQAQSSQPWQLNYWKQRSDMPEVVGSETKAGYYQDYMGFLKQEIPRIKSDLIQLERKKLYLRAQRAASQSRSASVSIVDLDAEDYNPSSVDEVSEEDEEEEEEEDEEEEEVDEANDEGTGSV